MFYKKNKQDYHSRIPGISQKTLVHGEKTLLAEFFLQKGAEVPLHSHPYEQTGYLISGHMVFTIEGEQFDALPGDSWCIASDVEHKVDVLEDTLVVEVFSPVRKDYLPGRK
ncbi:MAG: cupin domain-containing protein [Syntrophaceae bacterium]|jgi:quercetin dioxygenase-like cupin family protein|nr:cupin domain-containing protein [Syntrophaceae bacterium]